MTAVDKHTDHTRHENRLMLAQLMRTILTFSFYEIYFTSRVKKTNSAHGRSNTAEQSVESACRRLVPPTSTESFLEALL